MIVQSSADGRRHRVILQLDHMQLAGSVARLWGNERFAPLFPRELVEHVVVHHDQGWAPVDARIGRDPTTGLPFNLVKTPLAELLTTGTGGPDLCEKHHPYCGLLASMHSYGLYTGRYGLSDKVFVDMVPAEARPRVDDFLQGELARQARLNRELPAEWIEERALFASYKALQFFDTLSLYFNCTHDEARATSVFQNVPRDRKTDVAVTVRRVEAGVYALDPFPLRESGVTVEQRGVWLEPQPEGTDMAAAIASGPVDVETITFVKEAS